MAARKTRFTAEQVRDMIMRETRSDSEDSGEEYSESEGSSDDPESDNENTVVSRPAVRRVRTRGGGVQCRGGAGRVGSRWVRAQRVRTRGGRGRGGRGRGLQRDQVQVHVVGPAGDPDADRDQAPADQAPADQALDDPNNQSDEDLNNQGNDDTNSQSDDDGNTQSDDDASQNEQRPRQWRMADMEEPVIHQFQVPNPGPQVDTDGFTPIQYYQLYLTEALIDLMVTETNRYAQQWKDQHPNPKPYSRTRKWTEIDATELKKFLGLTLLMGLVKQPRIHMYWSNDKLFTTPVFRAVMTRDRYIIIMKFWHCTNNEDHQGTRDRLYKCHDVLNLLNERFQEVYKLSQNIALDESLLLYKGRLIFKQYISTKRARFGIKQFILAESTGYVYRMKVYTGSQDPDPDALFSEAALPEGTHDMTKTEKLVVSMIQDLLDLGHSIYVDNYYTSVRLFAYLHGRATNACGTLRKNRAPAPLRNARVPVGQTEALKSDDNLLALKFHDKREVYMLTTLHNEETRDVRRRGRARRNQPRFIAKPKCILSYNVHMGGVDRVDQVGKSIIYIIII